MFTPSAKGLLQLLSIVLEKFVSVVEKDKRNEMAAKRYQTESTCIASIKCQKRAVIDWIA